MEKKPSLKALLSKASGAARRKASRKNLPIAISENGEIKLIYPDNKVRVLHKKKHKKAL
jgi:hypothetical protein